MRNGKVTKTRSIYVAPSVRLPHCDQTDEQVSDHVVLWFAQAFTNDSERNQLTLSAGSSPSCKHMTFQACKLATMNFTLFRWCVWPKLFMLLLLTILACLECPCFWYVLTFGSISGPMIFSSYCYEGFDYSSQRPTATMTFVTCAFLIATGESHLCELESSRGLLSKVTVKSP